MSAGITGIVRSLRVSGILLILGLGTELISLLWEKPLAFLLFRVCRRRALFWPEFSCTCFRLFPRAFSVLPCSCQRWKSGSTCTRLLRIALRK